MRRVLQTAMFLVVAGFIFAVPVFAMEEFTGILEAVEEAVEQEKTENVPAPAEEESVLTESVSEETAEAEDTAAVLYAASGTCGTNLTWVLDDAGTLSISGTGDMTKWGHVSYTPWYSYQTKIKNVIIEDGVTSLGSHAFEDCSNLVSVGIPSSVTVIYNSVFNDCPKLADVIIPYGVQTIGNWAFYGCDSIQIIEIPDSVTSIGNYCFFSCSGLKTVNIGVGVNEIGYNAFHACDVLQNIYVEEANTAFGSIDGVLFTADGTTLVRCPGGRSGSYTVPSGVKIIGSGAFTYCTKLRSVKLQEGVTTLEAWAFGQCSGLTKLELPESMRKLEQYALGDCTALTEITIPKNVWSMDSTSLEGCQSLRNIYVEDGSAYYSDIGGVLYNAGGTVLMSFPAGRTGKYSVPAGTNTIKASAFHYSRLSEVKLPEGLTTIEEYAFSFCKNLQTLVIPEGVETIPCGICYFGNLRKIVIPLSVTFIDWGAFSTCDLTDIYYAGSEEAWEAVLIEISNKEEIEAATMHFNWPSGKAGANVVWSLDKDGVLTISGTGSVYNYSSSSAPWYLVRDKIKTVVVKSGITGIGNNNFVGCENLEKAVLPETMQSIGSRAFFGCYGLEHVYFDGTADEWGIIDPNGFVEAIVHFQCIPDEYTSVITEPSCEEKGYTTFSCVCGAHVYQSDYSDALGHDTVTDAAVAPTCEETGLTEGSHCVRCGEVLEEQEEIAALGHDAVTDAAVAPTCEETGLTEGSHCARCGEVLEEQEEIAALGHDAVTDAAVAPTCEETGLTEGSHCVRCGDVLEEQEDVAAIGHVWDNGVVTKEPTPWENGERMYSCHCGKTRTEQIEALAKRGDVNRDGLLNAKDTVALMRFLAGYEDGIDLKEADANYDESINILDVIRLIRYLAS